MGYFGDESELLGIGLEEMNNMIRYNMIRLFCLIVYSLFFCERIVLKM
jgi:hypothetical protein